MPIWERSRKDDAAILAELQAIDAKITAFVFSGATLTVKTDSGDYDDATKAALAAYSPSTMARVDDKIVSDFNNP